MMDSPFTFPHCSAVAQKPSYFWRIVAMLIVHTHHGGVNIWSTDSCELTDDGVVKGISFEYDGFRKVIMIGDGESIMVTDGHYNITISDEGVIYGQA